MGVHFVRCKSFGTARKRHPKAIIRRMGGGLFLCFDRYDEYLDWHRQVSIQQHERGRGLPPPPSYHRRSTKAR